MLVVFGSLTSRQLSAFHPWFASTCGNGVLRFWECVLRRAWKANSEHFVVKPPFSVWLLQKTIGGLTVTRLPPPESERME